MSESKSRYSDIIRLAKEDDQIASQPENQIASQPENQAEKLVNLCVKVPESLRRHWAAEAKRQGVTMTEVMAAALEARFGKP